MKGIGLTGGIGPFSGGGARPRPAHTRGGARHGQERAVDGGGQEGEQLVRDQAAAARTGLTGGIASGRSTASACLAEAEHVRALLIREVEHAVDMSVPLTAEVKTGNRWYEVAAAGSV
jgi:hypothetical protein